MEKIQKIINSKIFLCVMMSILILLGLILKFSFINMDIVLIILLILWLAICLFIPFEKAMCVLMFLMTLPIIELRGGALSYFTFMFSFTVGIFGIKHFIKVYKKEEKLATLPLLFSALLILYSLIDIRDFYWGGLLGILSLAIGLYVFFVYRDSISCKKLFDYALLGMIVNVLLSGILCVFPSLRDTFIAEDRFMGFFSNPNSLAIYSIITLSVDMMLFLKNDFGFAKFFISSTIVVIGGIFTMSKAFLLCLVILLILFSICYIKKNKKQGWSFFSACVLVGVVFVLIFMDNIKDILNRFTVDYGYDNILDVILTGRYSIWKTYINTWSSSAISIIFGCGAFAPWIGGKAPHSIYVGLLYNYGVIGCMLICATIAIYYLEARKEKYSFKLSNFIPLFMFCLLGIEESLLGHRLLLVWVLSLSLYKDDNIKSKEKDMIGQKLKFIKMRDVLSLIPMCLAFIPAMITKIFVRDFWLICEEKNEARDNGYWFFKYVRENKPTQKCAYAINKKSPDYIKVKDLGKVISYGGFAHWFWYFVADKNISSQKGGKPDNAVCYFLEVVLKLRKNNRVFLQHGVIVNDLEWLYYKNTNMRLFVTSTYPEYNFVKEKFGYPEGYVQLLGLPRFDNLNNDILDKDIILVMPTWRQWIAKSIESKDIEGSGKFEDTEYYKGWSEFLKSDKLDKILKKYNKKLLFYPHRNMQKYISSFEAKSENITICNWGNNDIQEVLKRASIMITDYSSVFFDFWYMKKPVLFYQFDEEKFRKYQYSEGYFSYRNNDLGKWSDNIDDLLGNLEGVLSSGASKMDDKKYDEYFKYTDNCNCERVYDAIKGLSKKQIEK